ncbi:MAG: hypothetical protein ACRD2O_05220 [Terriglobia bacterium]
MKILIAYKEFEPPRAFEWLLRSPGVLTSLTNSCQQTQALLSQSWLPHAIFTAPCLVDGTWSDILRSARQASPSLPVIVMASQPDVKFYLDVIESGAFDFIAPPYSLSDLHHVLKSVALHTGLSNPTAVRHPTTAA